MLNLSKLLLKVFFSLLLYHCCSAKLVEIQKINSTILIELYFCSHENFIGKPLYPDNAKAYVLEEVARALSNVQEELATYNLGLKIMDALRPMWAQRKLWDAVIELNIKNADDYVSNPYDPAEGGRHTRGTSVDVTLINLADGSELVMPPLGFTQEAHQDYIGNLTQEQIAHREFLKKIMLKHNFTAIRCEWWHFDYKNWRNYPSINKTFAELDHENDDN